MTHVPVRSAQAMTETGPACLGMVLAAHGRRVGQEELRVACGVGRDGTELESLARAAEAYGCDASITDAQDMDAVSLPAIVTWGRAHVVVLASRHGSTWHLIDPLTGRAECSSADLAANLGGKVLSLRPTESFKAGSTERGLVERATSRLKGNLLGLLFVVVAGLALVAPGLVIPAFVGVFVDTYLAAGSRVGALGGVVGLVIATGLSILILILQKLGLRRLTTATVTRTSSHFIWHVMRMPAWFYGQRDATTLAYRVGLNEQLADTLSGQFANGLLAQLTSLFFLIGIAIYSPPLALVALVGYLVAVLLVARIGRVRSEVRLRQAREASVTATQLGVSLRLLETLKATGSEDVAFRRVYGSVGRKLSLGFTHLWGYLSMVPVLTIAATTSLVLGVGALQVIHGTITIGNLATISLLLAGFLAPITVLVPSIDAAYNLRGALDQLDDVMDQHVDAALWDTYADGPEPTGSTSMPTTPHTESRAATPAPQQQGDSDGSADELDALLRGGITRRRKLTVDPWAASIELRDVTFGYSPSGPPLLRNVSINVPAGRVVAIVGGSGSGKSTIGRLIAGLYHPWSGEVLLDGRDLLSHSSGQRARDLAFVDQDVVLYAASVRDNITMFSPDIPDRDMIAAASDALIHDDIVSRPGGYDAPVAEDGRDRSGGQRQRMVIARALVRQPRLIVLDEATSALDARTEAQMVANLRARACTALVIAHRLSTVRDADEIIVLDQGRIAERGTHGQLAASDGLYRRLMDA